MKVLFRFVNSSSVFLKNLDFYGHVAYDHSLVGCMVGFLGVSFD